MIRFLPIVRKIWWARYAVLTVVSPLLIVAVAKTFPSLLRGLLLLRLSAPDAALIKMENGTIGSAVVPSLLRGDLAWLTWMSAMVVALGLAIARLIDLHGEARMNRGLSAIAEADPTTNAGKSTVLRYFFRQHESVGWPIAPTLVWIALSVSYPFMAARETIMDQLSVGAAPSLVQELRTSAAVGIVAGLGLAIVGLIGLGLLRTVLVGGRSIGCGLFFGEGIALWLLRKTKLNLASERKPMFWSLPFHIPGLTDKQTRQLLPGHPQLLVALVVSSTVYVSWYLKSLSSATWDAQAWPVGFYLLLVIYCGSAVFSFVTFMFDRYRIPVTIVALIYLAVPSDAHRFFELEPTEEQREIARTVPSDAEHLLLRALSQRPDDLYAYPQPPRLEEIYGKSYHFPVWPDKKRTMVVVTASGGGIQAAGWTARVLTGLEQRFPVIAESIGLISCVSGGSVGAMNYVAHRNARINDPHATDWKAATKDQLYRINGRSVASGMEAIGWGVAFPDFARSVMPIRLWRHIDRGWALEAAWWNRIGPDRSAAKWMKEVRMRDLIQPTRDGKFPPIVFNATAVETGQRVLISNVQTNGLEGATYESVDQPIDFLDFYGGEFDEPQRVNPRLTTAVRLSATFAYVTPVAKPLPPAEPPRAKSDGSADPGAERENRLQIHLCDGGYADNTGLVTAIRMVQDLIAVYEDQMKQGVTPPFERVIFLRIEPFPTKVAATIGDNTGLKAAFLGPLTALAATRSSSQAERADLELSLLMGLSRSGFSAAESDGLASLQDWMHEVQTLAEVAETELVDAKFATLREQVSALAQVSTDSFGSEELQSRVRAVKSSVNDLQDDPAPTLLRIAEAMSQFDEGRELHARNLSSSDSSSQDDKKNRIEIRTALFPFGDPIDAAGERTNGPQVAEGPNEKRRHNPPLSWRLSAQDILAIEKDWARFERKLDRHPGTDVKDETTTESKGELLNKNLLQPDQLNESAAPRD